VQGFYFANRHRYLTIAFLVGFSMVIGSLISSSVNVAEQLTKNKKISAKTTCVKGLNLFSNRLLWFSDSMSVIISFILVVLVG